MFMVFPAIQLADTSSHVVIADETPFQVDFTLASEQYYSGVLPLYNNLDYALYAADHVSVVENPAIGGYINYAIYGGADLVMWNSSYDLVAGNGFQVASVGIIAFGGTSNVFWGNAFTLSVPIVPDPSFVLNYGNSVALYLYESGDLVYNNYFGTPNTAFTPADNPYDFFFVPELWTDLWNVSYQPATDVNVVNGFGLSGNILGLSYEGGNFWSNYGSPEDPYGVLPYDNGGNIVVGGDFLPLVPFALFSVTFTETGLLPGTAWSVIFNGYNQTSTASSMVFYEPNGTYAFQVAPISGYTATPSLGAVVVAGAPQTVAITWT
jgi:hypothetical protein